MALSLIANQHIRETAKAFYIFRMNREWARNDDRLVHICVVGKTTGI